MKMYKSDIMEEFPTVDTWTLNDFGALPLDMEDLWSSNSVNDKLDLHLDMNLNDDDLKDIHDFILDMERKEIVHDCMWAGTCSDKYHPPNEHSPVIPKVPAVVNPQPQVPAPATVQTASPGRSLLINAARQPQPVPQQPQQIPANNYYRKTIVPTMIHSPQSPQRPDTPQSLDEEHPQFKHNLDIADCDPSQIVVKEEIIDDDDDDNEDEEEEEYSEEEYTNVQEARNARENTIATDHSYTLSKNSKQTRVELPGVQTPSDSEEEEEEIDVVSLVEMNVTMNRSSAAMQTNPSILARRQLQRKVASSLEAHTIAAPPRKRPRERSASPISRHRKRPKAPKQRAQQHHHHNGHHAQSSRNSPTKRRPYSSNSDSEAENIERRSLHNDMERQRRIGLKNLFDELKSVVPAISQKDRAPKVVVLREAALLCERVQIQEQNMDDEMDQLKMKQAMLMARLKQLRREAASRRPRNA